MYNSNILLEENDSLIIKKVLSADISPNGKIIAFTDISQEYVATYNVHTGKIQNQYWSNVNLSDYFFKYNEYDQTDASKHFEYGYINNDTARAHGLNPKEDLINSLEKVRFISNDELQVGSTLRAYYIRYKDTSAVISNIASLIKLDTSLNVKKVIIFETSSNEYGNAELIFPLKNNKYIVETHSCNGEESGKYDSLSLYSQFDSIGKHEKLLCFTPSEYAKLKIGYTPMYGLSMSEINGKYFWTAMLDYKIRNLFDNTDFEIKGVDSSNFFAWITFSKKTLSYNYRPVFYAYYLIQNIGNWNDSLIVVYLTDRESNQIIQYYSIIGELKKQYILLPPDGQIFEYVLFDSKNHLVYAMSTNKKNYYLTSYKVDL